MASNKTPQPSKSPDSKPFSRSENADKRADIRLPVILNY
jgi:hypothetical protein